MAKRICEIELKMWLLWLQAILILFVKPTLAAPVGSAEESTEKTMVERVEKPAGEPAFEPLEGQAGI
jgi:hypothetical protein